MELREFVDRLVARAGVGGLALESRHVNSLAARCPRQIAVGHFFDHLREDRGIGREDGVAADGTKLLERLAVAVLEVVIHVALEDRVRDVKCGRHVVAVEKARGAQGFKAHARAFVVGSSFQKRQRIRHPVAPIANDAHGLRTGARLGRLQDGVQQIGVHDVVPLVDPQRFEAVVLVGRLLFIERLLPLLDGGDDLRGVVRIEFDLRALADVVLMLLQQTEEVLDRFAGDLFRLQQRATRKGDAIDAAMLVVAIRIAQMMLQVADEHLRPVHHVERSIRRDGDAARAEVRILRDVGIQQRIHDGLTFFILQRLAFGIEFHHRLTAKT